MKIKRELITYLISGVLTTGVNYLLYAGFLAMQIPYLAANSAAWSGAVLTTAVWSFTLRNMSPVNLHPLQRCAS